MNELTITKGWEDLKIFEQDTDAWVSSRNISEIFEKNHQHVLEKIHEILKNPDDFTASNFRQSVYTNKQNKKQPAGLDYDIRKSILLKNFI
jgi:Rha family phage regulatory protein